MASPEHAKLVELLRANKPSAAPLEVMRAQVDKMRSTFVDANARAKIRPDTKREQVDAGGVRAEWFTPAGVRKDRVLLYLHGGGYVMGSVETHRSLVDDIGVAAGCRVLSLDYRLAPEAPFPAAIEDAAAAYRWLLDQGVDASRIVIGGDSAGGGLAAATLLSLRDAGDALPAGAALLSAWRDMEGTGESCQTRAREDPMVDPGSLQGMARLYVGDTGNLRDPLASPLLAQLHGLPPLLVQAGDWEVLRDDSTRFAHEVHAAGGNVKLSIWPEMVHVFPFFAHFTPEAREGVKEIGDFLRRCLDDAASS
jgi:acetyl esterase/lipase